MWDIYRTQLPLITALFPQRAAELANAMLNICEEEGNLPIGYRMAKGADRFSRQGSALAQTFLADLCQLGVAGVDWDWALCHMDTDLRRAYGEEYLLRGVTHPITHTLDLAFGYQCTAKVARYVGDQALAEQFEELATRWVNAFDPEDRPAGRLGVLRGRQVELLVPGPARHAGPDRARRRATRPSSAMLDRFFGYGADPVKQVGERPSVEDLSAGYALNRFEGLNNEPDMEVPWAYHYVGRPDRTAEVVHAAINNHVRTGPRRPAGQRRLRRAELLVRLGLARPVPGRRPEPVPDQRAVLRPRPGSTWTASELVIETDGFVEPEPDGPVQYVQSVTFNGEPLDRSWLAGPRAASRRAAEDHAWVRNRRPGGPRQPTAVGVPGRRRAIPSSSAAGLPADIAG